MSLNPGASSSTISAQQTPAALTGANSLVTSDPTSMPLALPSRVEGPVLPEFTILRGILNRARETADLPDGLRDLARSDIEKLFSNIELTRLVLGDPRLITDLERFGLRLSTLPCVEVAPAPEVKVLHSRMERIDNLGEDLLEEMRHFPDSAEYFLNQRPYTIPPSADPELYSREKIDELGKRVKAEVGNINLKMWIVRATLQVGDKTWADQPIHTLTSFDYKGELMIGPFFGTSAGLALRFCPEYSNKFKADLVKQLLDVVINDPRVVSTTISFAVPQRLDPKTQNYELSYRGLEKSAAHNILSSTGLDFTVFSMPWMMDGSTGKNVMNHMYYYRGPDYLPADPDFVRVIQTIREVRRQMRRESRASSGFLDIEEARDSVRRSYIEALLGLERRVRTSLP